MSRSFHREGHNVPHSFVEPWVRSLPAMVEANYGIWDFLKIFSEFIWIYKDFMGHLKQGFFLRLFMGEWMGFLLDFSVMLMKKKMKKKMIDWFIWTNDWYLNWLLKWLEIIMKITIIITYRVTHDNKYADLLKTSYFSCPDTESDPELKKLYQYLMSRNSSKISGVFNSWSGTIFN